MRVLGIDPGTQKLGYGVVDVSGGRARRVDGGVLEPNAGPLSERLAHLFDGLSDVVARTTPDVVAVEALFYARNVQSALTLGHARGVALLVAGRAGLPVHAYPPAVVKKAIVGHGRAEKQQMQKMIRALLSLPAEPPPDEADALAIALCHAQRARFAEAAPQLPKREPAPAGSKGRAETARVVGAGTPVVSAAELAALWGRAGRRGQAGQRSQATGRGQEAGQHTPTQKTSGARSGARKSPRKQR